MNIKTSQVKNQKQPSWKRSPWQWIYVCNYLLIIYLPNQTKKKKKNKLMDSKKRRAVDDDLLKSDKWWWNENFTAKFANSRENE